MWAVLQLPEKYRNCLYLFYYEDYSIKEIAQSLEMPENTVKTNLKRGRQALKEFWKSRQDLTEILEWRNKWKSVGLAAGFMKMRHKAERK